MNIRQLEAFRAVMRLKSVTAAARSLNVSQPSISRFLSDLELSVGFRLFQRQHGRIVPTAEAINFSMEIDRCFAGLDELQKSAERIRAATKGQLLIGSVPSLTFKVLPYAIGRFHRQLPDIAISCQNRDSDKLIDWTATNRLNIALVADQVRTSEVEVIRHFSANCLAVLSGDHPLVSAKVIGYPELKRYPFISLGRDFFQKHASGRRLVHEIADARQIETFSSYSACAMLAGTQGIAIVDPFTAAFFSSHCPVVAIRLADPIPYEFSLIKPAAAQQAGYVLKFVELLVAKIDSAMRASMSATKGSKRQK